MSELWGYARVSSEEQQLDCGALRKQIERLRGAGCEKIYWDVQSRTTEVRDGLQRLIDDLNSSTGQVKALVFTRIDRIGSSSKLFYSLLEILRAKNIKLQALDQSFDVDSIGGELTIDMLLAAAKFEVKMLRSRLKVEREHRISQGKAHNQAPFGYRVEGEKYVRDELLCVCLLEGKHELRVWEVARYIFDSFLIEGTVNAACRKIHADFGISVFEAVDKDKEVINHLITDDNLEAFSFVPTKSRSLRYPWTGLRFSLMAIRNILVNPVYAGGTPFNTVEEMPSKNGKRHRNKKHFDKWQIIWDTHPDTAIISRLEHEQIKTRVRNNNKWSGNELSDPNPFAHILKCSCCGATMTRSGKYKSLTGNRYKFQCRRYRTGGCKRKKMINSHKLEEQTVAILVAEANRLASAVNTFNLQEETQEPPELLSLRDTLAALENLPSNPNIEQAKRGIQTEIAALLNQAQAESANQEDIKERLIKMFSTRRFWDSLSLKDKKEVLSSLIRRILVDNGRVISIDFLY